MLAPATSLTRILALMSPWIAVGMLATVCARELAMFPPPWSDEVHFLIPSAPWGSGHVFDATAMLRPEGIFWLPLGYYVFNASLFSAVGSVSLVAARTGSLVAVMIAAALLAFLHRRLLPAAPAAHAGWFAALWSVSPPIVLASQIARPEALVMCLTLLGLWASTARRTLASSACALIALCVHPLLGVPALVACWMGLLLLGALRPRPFEVALAALALALFAAELARFCGHPELYGADWAFQLQRKSSRERPLLAWVTGLSWAAASISALCLRWPRARAALRAVALIRAVDWMRAAGADRRSAVLATVGVACVFVHVYGQEMWYPALRSTGLALLVLVGAVCFSRRVSPSSTRGPGLRPSKFTLGFIFAAMIASWGVGVAKGHVQGIPLALSGMAGALEDRRQIEQQLTQALAADAETATLISPWLAAPFLTQLQRGQLFVVNALSRPEHIAFGRAVYFERAYPGRLEDGDTLGALRGYECQESRRLRSSHGHYQLVLARVRRQAPQLARAPFRACQLDAAASR